MFFWLSCIRLNGLPLHFVFFSTTQDEHTVIVPTDTEGEGMGAELNWEEIESSVKGFPRDYILKLQAQQNKPATEDDDDEPGLPLVPMICHRVKVQRSGIDCATYSCSASHYSTA